MSIDPSLSELALVTLIMLIGSASQAAIGMGLNLFAIPLLLLIDPLYAPGPVLVASFALSFLALRRVPATVDRNELHFALIGLVSGTLVGGALVASVETASLARLLGAFVVIAVGLSLSSWSVPIGPRNLVLAGSGSGFLGTVAGVHAPPIALLYLRAEPERVRGAILTFVGIGNGLSIVALVLAGRFEGRQIVATALLVPGVLVGLWIAPVLVRLIEARALRFSVLSISALSGLMLVFG